MKRIRALVCLVAMALILVSASGGAVAAEIRVLSGGAVKAALTDLADAWGKETGHRAAIAYATTGASMQKIVAGEPVDVIILAAEAIEQLARKGAVAAGTVTDIARAGIGVAARQGATKPDISTPEAVNQSVLAAKSVAYMAPTKGETSGMDFTKVLEQMGIVATVAPKAVLVESGFAAERVATGEAEIVVHQISETLPVKGVTLIGPLPKEIQKVTVYAAAVAATSPVPDAAKAFIAFLTTPAARAKFASVGLDYRE